MTEFAASSEPVRYDDPSNIHYNNDVGFANQIEYRSTENADVAGPLPHDATVEHPALVAREPREPRHVVDGLRIHAFQLYAGGVAQGIAGVNRKRHRLTIMTDASNTSPVSISHNNLGNATDALPLMPGATPFVLHSGHAVYAWGATGDRVYVIDESYAE